MLKLDTKQTTIQKDRVLDVKEIPMNIDNKSQFINSGIQNNLEKTELDFKNENRLVKIISLYSKGFTQQEISFQLGINQSTVSRDLQHLREGARDKIWEYMNKEILFEYMRYIVSNNDTTERLWKIIDDESSNKKEKISALTLLNQVNKDRIEILMKAPESYLSVKENIGEIKEHDKVQSNSFLKFTKELSSVNNIILQNLGTNISTKR